MAVVPELEIMSLGTYSEYEEEFYGDHYEKKTSVRQQEWTSYHSSWSTCRSLIKPQIRKPKKPVHSIKKAIMLVVVVEKLKGRKEFDQWSYFEDSDLLLEDSDLRLDDILVEEKICCINIQGTCEAPHNFRPSNKTVHIIKDSREKFLTLKASEGRARLIALFLEGENLKNKAKIEVGSYTSVSDVGEKCPVTLSIAGRNLFLCCNPGEDGGDTPVLSLTEKTNGDLLPYLFYRTQNHTEETTFESVAFPGWYITTSQQEDKAMQMKPENDQESVRDFLLCPEDS